MLTFFSSLTSTLVFKNCLFYGYDYDYDYVNDYVFTLTLMLYDFFVMVHFFLSTRVSVCNFVFYFTWWL